MEVRTVKNQKPKLMFGIFVDKNCIENLSKLHSSSDPLWVDFTNFLNQVKLLKLITNLESEEELKLSIERNPLWFILTENISEIIYSKPTWNNLNGWVCKHECPFIFFLSDNSESFSAIDANGYFYLSSNELTKQWEPLSKVIPREFNVTNGQMPAELHFNTFEKLKKVSRGFNSLIILDHFLFVNSHAQSYKDNLEDLLNTLFSINRSKNCDIMFFAHEQKGFLPQTKGWTKRKKFHRLFSEMHQWLEKFESIRFKITMCCLKSGIPIASEIHDRRIYTNNFLISCGAGFNLFKKEKNGNLRAINNTTVNIQFIFWAETMFRVKQDIYELHEYLKKLPNNDFENQPNYYPQDEIYPSLFSNHFS